MMDDDASYNDDEGKRKDRKKGRRQHSSHNDKDYLKEKKHSEHRSRKRHRKEDDDSFDSSREKKRKGGNRSRRDERVEHHHESNHHRRDRSQHRHKKSHRSKGARDEHGSESEEDEPRKRKERRRDRDDDRGRRRRNSTREEEERSKKTSRKKETKSSNERATSGKDSRAKKSAKGGGAVPDKSGLVSLGDILGHEPSEGDKLSAEKDYYAYHQHLWVYLYREEGLAFNDLTSEESQEAFARFVAKFNAGELEVAYYSPKGLPSAALDETKTTRHAWNFQTSAAEDRSLHMVQEGVRRQTDYDDNDGGGTAALRGGRETRIDSSAEFCRLAEPSKGDEPRNRNSEDRYRERAMNRRLREHVRTAEEEFGVGGRKEGRERQIEKRKELSAKIHGASKDRDAAMELTDDALYGGQGDGEIGFQAALAREKRREEQRQEKRDARIKELQTKGNEKQAAMMEMLGLSGMKPGQKITIQPRKDGG